MFHDTASPSATGPCSGADRQGLPVPSATPSEGSVRQVWICSSIRESLEQPMSRGIRESLRSTDVVPMDLLGYEWTCLRTCRERGEREGVAVGKASVVQPGYRSHNPFVCYGMPFFV